MGQSNRCGCGTRLWRQSIRQSDRVDVARLVEFPQAAEEEILGRIDLFSKNVTEIEIADHIDKQN